MKRYFYKIGILLGIVIIGGTVFWGGIQRKKSMPETEEKIVFAETKDVKLSENKTDEMVQNETERETRKDVEQSLFLEEWNSGMIEGSAGENQYTAVLKNGSIDGNAEEFLTFEYLSGEGNVKNAFVVAGRQKEEGFSGSIWFVSESGEYKMLEQNVVFLDNMVIYQEFDKKRYLFLNFLKEGQNCGRVFLCNDSMPKEILMAALGKKTVDRNGNVICMYLSEDSRSKMETNLYTGEKYYKREGYTEKPYTLQWYKDGTIREVQASLVTEEELLSYPYGAEIVQKAEEVYPQEKKQYIIRENGEVNVNVAVKDGEDINFFYMTFQTANQVLFVDSGIGCYFLYMTNDSNWGKFLKDFVEKDFYIRNYLKNFIHNPFIEKTDSEGDVFWNDLIMTGEEFIPEGDLLERLSGLVFDYSENWDRIPKWTHDIVIGSEEEREFYLEVRLIGKTESFWIYGTNNINDMILKTKDEIYLWLDVNYTSLYFVQPQFFEADFDQDGETELIIQGQFGLHGSGVYIESLFLADRDFDGKWKVYQMQEDWYISEMEKYYQTAYANGQMNLLVNGELVGVPVEIKENETYTYSGRSQIHYQIKEDRICLYSELMVYAEQNPLYDIFERNGLCMEISYLGNGKWKTEQVSYYSAALEQAVQYAVLDLEGVKEIKAIQYNPMFVRECAITEGSLIPVEVIILTKQGEERLIEMEVSYRKGFDKEKKEFQVESIKYHT